MLKQHNVYSGGASQRLLTTHISTLAPLLGRGSPTAHDAMREAILSWYCTQPGHDMETAACKIRDFKLALAAASTEEERTRLTEEHSEQRKQLIHSTRMYDIFRAYCIKACRPDAAAIQPTRPPHACKEPAALAQPLAPHRLDVAGDLMRVWAGERLAGHGEPPLGAERPWS